MSVFTHRGARLHFRDEGQGLPVLLLHAFPLRGEMFAEQLGALSAKYRFIVPDLRGFGQSELGAVRETTMTLLAQDALALLDHLGVDSAVAGGVSMGGYAAMAALQLDPSRVRALVLADTQMGADDEAGRARRAALAEQVEATGMKAVKDALLPKLLAQPPAPEPERRVIDWMLSNPPAGTAAALRGMAVRADSRDILARFAGPALLIAGERDEVTPRKRADELAAVMGNAQVVEIPGAGHLANLDAPDAFNRALDSFLQGI